MSSSIFNRQAIPHQRTIRHKKLLLQEISIRNDIVNHLKLRETPIYQLKMSKPISAIHPTSTRPKERHYKSKSIIQKKSYASRKKPRMVGDDQPIKSKTTNIQQFIIQSKMKPPLKHTRIALAKQVELTSSNILFTAPDQDPQSRTPSLQNRQRGFRQSKLVRIRTEPQEKQATVRQRYDNLKNLLNIKQSKRFCFEGASFPVIERSKNQSPKPEVYKQSKAINLKITSIKGWNVRKEQEFLPY